MEESGAIGPACFGPRIREEPFPKGFMLPRDTPKYNGTVKPEDWLTDYTTAIGITSANRRLAVRYAPLMLQGSARTWLNSLPMGSINTWVDFEEAYGHNFTGTYNRPGRPSQLAMSVKGPTETGREYLAHWTKLRNSWEGVHEVQAIQYFVNGCRDSTLLKHKLLRSKSATIAALMVMADKYANANSGMKIQVVLDEAGKAKPVPPSKASGENNR